VRAALQRGLGRIERYFDSAFSPDWNPIKQLGAIGWFLFWTVAVSGIYLYIFFDTGVTQAYTSVQALTDDQWYAGGVMRSLHRYASDGLVVVVLLHLLREFVKDRFRGRRWFAWVTGVALLWLLYASGITGYWIVWDKLAQYVAVATSEWLDSLPIFGPSIARQFLSDELLSGRFFTLMSFIHIAVPLILLFAMWIHIQRLQQPRVNPPRGLGAGTMLMLVVLSLIKPAQSQGPAVLAEVPANVGLDWFYLTVYPLLDRWPGGALWALLIGATLLMFVLPWLPPLRRLAVAKVDLGNCNGCGRCVADCPYSAITLEPRTDRLPYSLQAVVREAACVSCGICAGACPTAMPQRRRSALIPGIELPDQPVAELRAMTESRIADLSAVPQVLIYHCRHAARVPELLQSRAAVVALPCLGALPPAFIDWALFRAAADGLMLVGCGAGDCHYRLGVRWTEARLARQRDPNLRARVPEERVARCWASPGSGNEVVSTFNDFQARLSAEPHRNAN
jgi:ferredoxin/coenzyme F420-reducing hydrogenase delta subunit